MTTSRSVAILLLVILVFATGPHAAAQKPSESDHAQALRFDAVSIEPSKAHLQSLRITKDGYEAIGTPLESTLEFAYAPAPYFKHLGEMKGLPAWVINERYDLKATIFPKDRARWHALNQNIMQDPVILQRMLQRVLAERCNLRIHSVPVKVDAFALRIATKSAALAQDTALPAKAEATDLADGAKLVLPTRNNPATYTFYNTSMPVLADFLSIHATAKVVDNTGLKGRYSFVLHHVAPRLDGIAVPMPFVLSDVGLTVQKIKVDAQRWIVDRITRP